MTDTPKLKPRSRFAAWFNALSPRDLFALALPSLLILAAGFWFAAKYVKPAPPTQLVMSTGGAGSGYQLFAARYRPIIEGYGIQLDERASAGSLENLQRLKQEQDRPDMAFIQGGTALTQGDEHLMSLGAIYNEPVWLFYRSALGLIERIEQLRGRRLAIGPEGSGTRFQAKQLLEAHDMAEGAVTLQDFGGLEALASMQAGKTDAAILVGAPRSAAVWAMLFTPGVRVMSFTQASAYVRRFSHLTRLTLPRGTIDFVRDVPPRDLVLVAPRAYVVAHEDTHPALIDLMLQAMRQTHGGADLFQRAAEFPQADGGEFPLHPRAARFYESGPPLLQRYLPFSVANLVDRMVVLLVPLLALALPLLRILPPLYTWRVRSRLYRWYGELKDIEHLAEHEPEVRSREEWLEEIDRIDQAVSRLRVPLAHADYHYQLRAHIRLVRERLAGREAQARAQTMAAG